MGAQLDKTNVAKNLKEKKKGLYTYYTSGSSQE